MEVDPVNPMDSYPRASEIFDAIIGKWIRDSYGVYIAKFVSRTHIATAAQVLQNRKRGHPTREDLHGKWPDCGDDAEGNLLDPTKEQMIKFHREVHMIVQTIRDMARDRIDDFFHSWIRRNRADV